MPASLAPVISIDPSDPAYALVRATKALNEQAQKEFGALCEKLAMEVVASVTAAQDSARSQAEAIIGQSGALGGRGNPASGKRGSAGNGRRSRPDRSLRGQYET